MYRAHGPNVSPWEGTPVSLPPHNAACSTQDVKFSGGQTDNDLRVMAIVSGKGGVGKTNVAANLSILMARRGRRVLLIDADLGSGNIDIVLGLTTRFSLYDVVFGHIDLTDILVEGPGGVWVLPAGSGVYEMTCLNDQQRYAILDQIDTLEDRFDTVVIDNSAGITPDVQFFAGAAHEVIVVTDREPTAITDAYTTIQILCQRRYNRSFHLLVNSVETEEEGRTVYRRLTTVTNRFLDVSIGLLGSVPRDENLNRAVMARQALVDLFPNSPASLSLDHLATKLLSTPPPKGEDGGMKMFWERLLRQNAAATAGETP